MILAGAGTPQLLSAHCLPREPQSRSKADVTPRRTNATRWPPRHARNHPQRTPGTLLAPSRSLELAPDAPWAAFRARSEPLLARSWSLLGAPGPFLVLSWPTPGSLLACSWHAFNSFRRGPTALDTLFIYRTAGTLKNTCHPTPAQCLQEDTPAGPWRSPALSRRLPALVGGPLPWPRNSSLSGTLRAR